MPVSVIPVAPSLQPTLAEADMGAPPTPNRARLVRISALAVAIGVVVTGLAKVLVWLIHFFTNVAFYGEASGLYRSPADAVPHLGAWVIIIPVIGGLIIGLMALYGSPGVRGHGIPEAIEQILTNQSRIRPVLTLLKPLSAAISVGTGGPFGAEGPIIATGGAFGSTVGQLLHITHHERKVLLAAGATAGMTAVFGTPVAAVFLAVELLLYEFSPRSLVPVTLACITGAAGHHLLFEQQPVFALLQANAPGNLALATYSAMGLVMGLLAVLITHAVGAVEHAFERLPIHWAWWPALGGLAVGVVGYFAPRTLGVGYENITDILAGRLVWQAVLVLGVLKFTSWVISLGSGTSGGTLAPLFTIGTAAGALLGTFILRVFPASDINLTMAALVGMAALFAGASRALLTSIVFAVEATGQPTALLPLLGACTASYVVSFFLLQHTLMTEKVGKRGVRLPEAYEPDVLERVTVGQVLQPDALTVAASNTLLEMRQWLQQEPEQRAGHFVLVSEAGEYEGVLSTVEIFRSALPPDTPLRTLSRRVGAAIATTASLRTAVELMSRRQAEVLPVVAPDSRSEVVGVLTYQDIIGAYRLRLADYDTPQASISLKRRTIEILLRGQRIVRQVKARS
ncbi:chloride channel protein [Hymenobacter sp. CRA2]|uniref:chloride channel protein n=1 Tax=Hymenobacter sp. CRA2 TaxID=1955620 RepID=UPI00098FF66A|nr:chloride channel protein [Hymenobacter sp. CRA2]OON67731.1 chloride channel protein [Hymenobacter sp. CRA2]